MPMTSDSFAQLCSDTAACGLCEAMAGRNAVMSELNGSLHPRVLFIAEAPGRKGGDRTRIPMFGDASGVAFRELLDVAGLTRDEIFITNAALCNPRGPTGANRKPTAAELRNCSHFLRRTIDLLDPPVLVTLGATALTALHRLEAHSITLSGAGQPHAWGGRTLIPVYHPSPQVLISRRSLQQQKEDWRGLGAFLRQQEIAR